MAPRTAEALRFVPLLSVAVAIVCAAAPAGAQIVLGPGAIVARVSDANGRALSGALVEAAGPTTRAASTNAAGIATLSALPAGTYDVSVSLAGYIAYGTRLSIAATGNAPQVVAPQLAATSFANLGNAAGVLAVPGLGATLDPFVAHALTNASATDVVGARAGVGISVDGTLPYESRVELDGIPLAGGSNSPVTVRFRDALGLAGIDVAASPFVDSPSLRDAIGGIVNLRTPAVDDPATAGVDAAHDSAFGSYEHARAVERDGSFAVAFDAVTGGGTDRSQSAKVRYAFSPGASIDVATYGLQVAGPVGIANVTSSAPAYAVGLRFGVGGGTFDARGFASALSVSTSVSSPFVANEAARTAGVELAYDLPIGTDALHLGFDRRGEQTALASYARVDQTFTTFDVRSDIGIARALRMQLADAYSGGTLMPARNDPAAALAFRPSSALLFRLSAGSDFATAPDTVLAGRNAASGTLAPETAFGIRLTGDVKLDPRDRVWLAAYRERRFDTFTALADATNRGVGLGFERVTGRGFGGLAYGALASDVRDGPAQPSARIASDAIARTQDPGDPYGKARAALTYRATQSCESHVGTTLLGAGNALFGRTVVLGDVALCVPVLGIASVRIGEENAFGAVVPNPVLAPLYRPHEVFLSIGLR